MGSFRVPPAPCQAGSFSLHQGFWNIRIHQDHRENLLKHRLPGSTPRLPGLVGQGWGWEYASLSLQVMRLLVWDLLRKPHFLVSAEVRVSGYQEMSQRVTLLFFLPLPKTMLTSGLRYQDEIFNRPERRTDTGNFACNTNSKSDTRWGSLLTLAVSSQGHIQS